MFVGLPVLTGIIAAWIDVGFGARFSYVFMVTVAIILALVHFAGLLAVQGDHPDIAFMLVGGTDILALLVISIFLWAAKKDRR